MLFRKIVYKRIYKTEYFLFKTVFKCNFNNKKNKLKEYVTKCQHLIFRHTKGGVTKKILNDKLFWEIYFRTFRKIRKLQT